MWMVSGNACMWVVPVKYIHVDGVRLKHTMPICVPTYRATYTHACIRTAELDPALCKATHIGILPLAGDR